MIKRFILFGGISTLGAAIDFVLTWWLLSYGFSAFLGFGLSMCVSATLVYLMHEFITFNQDRTVGFSQHRLFKFLFSTVLIYLLRVGVFYLLVYIGTIEVVAIGIALVSSVVINYSVSKFLIFK